tara:strand:- start:577 stop:1206 length:630 start_codon:yes stop_codon:yes gene_type:complete
MQIVKSNFNKILYVAIILTAIIAGWGLSKIFSSSNTSNEIDTSFRLIDNTGQNLTNNDLKGKSKVIFFGFTNCPDVCPISADLMSASINKIKNEELSLNNIEFIFITTDPKRDTPERMTEFLSDYNPKIIGLTGKYSNLKNVWKNFFVHVLPVNDDTQDHGDVGTPESHNYMVEHTAFYYLFDKKDRLSAILPFGTSEEILLTEIKKIL